MPLYTMITKRQSTRKFLQEPLSKQVLAEILAFGETVRPLDADGVKQMEIVDAADIQRMLAVKAPHYLLFYGKDNTQGRQNAGFMMQQMDLYLASRGIGSCWLGMAKAKKKEKFGLDFIIMLALGTGEEEIYRKDVSEFTRKVLGEISVGMDTRIESARLAPSAMNSQPWFFVCKDGYIDVFQKKLGPVKAAVLQDLNDIDMGIALSHLYLASQAQGKPFALQRTEKPRGITPEGYRMIGSISVGA